MSDVMGQAKRLEKLLPKLLRCLHTPNDDPLAELPMTQLRIIRHLEETSLTPGALAAEMNTTLGAVTQIISRLEEAGLVIKSTDELDRRVRHLALSDRAKLLLEKRAQSRAQRASEVLARMSPDERRDLMAALENLLDVSRLEEIEGLEPLSITIESERG